MDWKKKTRQIDYKLKVKGRSFMAGSKEHRAGGKKLTNQPPAPRSPFIALRNFLPRPFPNRKDFAYAKIRFSATPVAAL
jgi:hypothetical protein